jgi:mannosylfructose-phosphate synthase
MSSTHNNILVVSRFVPAKGIDQAIDIFNLVAQRADAHLYIVTASQADCFSEEEVSYREAVEGRVQRYGLEDRVTFLGYIQDRKVLADRYTEADIYLLPSRYEPFGLTAMEAMACGTVAVVSSVAGSCELIIDGVNGYVADMRDRRRTADLIVALLNNKRERKRTSENAKLTVEKHLAWDVIARNLKENLYPHPSKDEEPS